MRKPCPNYIRHELQNKQKNRCYYCNEEFGKVIIYKGRSIKLRVNCDHIIPYSVIKSSPIDNWAIVCQICNAIKSSKRFDTLKEIIDYVKEKRFKSEMRTVPKRISNKPTKENILQPKLSVARMGPETSTIKRIRPTKGSEVTIKLIPRDCCNDCQRPYLRGYKRTKTCVYCINELIEQMKARK